MIYLILTGPLRGKKICMRLFGHGIKKVLGIYEPEVTQKVIELTQGAKVCIDVGSHVGYDSLAMLQSMNPSGKLICIDPMKEDMDLLKITFKENRITNYVCFNVGLGDFDGVKNAKVYSDSGMARFEDSDFNNYLTPKSFGDFKVRTLDSISEEMSLEVIDFIKIDVEGYETKVINGGMKTLKMYKPTLLIEVHNREIGKALVPMLKNLNYEVSHLDGTTVSDIPAEIFYIVAAYSLR